MLRHFSLALSFCLSLLLNQPGALAADHAPSSALQVVYLQDDTTLTTYNVDPQTLNATQVGQPFNLPMTSFNGLAPSLDGKFLYIFGLDSGQNQHLWVFATDASGVPQSPAVQQLDANGMSNFELDPVAGFAYALVGTANSQNQTLYDIRRFTVDSATGKLSSPAIVTKYPLNGSCPTGVLGASPSLNGFSPSGDKFYDNWFCVTLNDSSLVTYFERTINPQTAALGKEVEVYNWKNHTQGYDTVSFTNNQIIDFSIPNPYGQGTNSLSIYPVVPNGTRPLLHCTASMLEACGDSLGEIVHPSGKYIFFTITYYIDQIAKVDLAANQLVYTGHAIPYQVAKFSADGTIVYALDVLSSSYNVEIYGFNPATADVTYAGGLIYAPSISDTFWPIARQ